MTERRQMLTRDDGFMDSDTRPGAWQSHGDFMRMAIPACVIGVGLFGLFWFGISWVRRMLT